MESNGKINELDLLDLDGGKLIDQGLRQTFSQGVRGGREIDRKNIFGSVSTKNVAKDYWSPGTTSKYRWPVV